MVENENTLTDALTALFESAYQAEYDFCGEQREWHLPRLQKAHVLLSTLFPAQAAKAMERAKQPDGEFVVER